MINIQNAVIIPYNGNQTVTVYFDFDPLAKKFYIVPVPRFSYTDTGEPVFSLTSYKQSSDSVTGVCYFDVELAVPPDALKAVKAQYPDYSQGQFDWVVAEGFFNYTGASGKWEQIAATASMYGANKVTFTVEITSNEMMEAFKSAFHGTGVSTFFVEYDVVALAKLVGVKATVSYDAAIAISWEKQYATKTDTWGNKSQVLVGVKENLQQSGAGDVKLDWSVEPSDEFRARVQDWAWATLEDMVAKAVDIAQAAATSQTPVESTASFVQNYEEDQVVEWSISTSNPLAKFDDATWNKVYHQVDLRKLVVTFNTLGQFTQTDGTAPVSKVDVTVKYGSNQPQTFTLIPTDGPKSSYTYTSIGDFIGTQFNPVYSYQYTVYYTTGSPYVSDWMDNEDTKVTINPSLLGMRTVTFIGSLIPFTKPGSSGKTVDKLLIDFYFTRPPGIPNKTEQKVMTANDEAGAVVFESYYNLPIENTYCYRYTYQFSDNTVIIVDTIQAFGQDNKDQLLVLFPDVQHEFTLVVSKPVAGQSAITTVDMSIAYHDQQNPVDDLYHSYNWDPNYDKKAKKGLQSKPWTFFAPNNPAASYYEMSGSLFFEDGTFIQINNFIQRVGSNDATFTRFIPGAIPNSITIDPSVIDWSVVNVVNVQMLQMKDGIVVIKPELLPYYLPSFPAGSIKRKKFALEAAATSYNLAAYPFTKPVSVNKGLKSFYTVQRLVDSESLSFYISAEYVQIDGSSRYMNRVEIKDQNIVTLPPNGNSSQPTLLAQTLVLPQKLHSKSKA